MKNGIRSALVSKRSFFLCVSLLACGSIGGTFTIPVADQHPDKDRTGAILPSSNTRASVFKPAMLTAPSAVHRKTNVAAATLPSFRNTISGDGRDADSHLTRVPVSMLAMGGGFSYGEPTHFDTLPASGAPDQGAYASGYSAPGGAYSGAASGTAGETASGGAPGAQPSSGWTGVTPTGDCLASPGSAILPLGAGGCFVSGGENSGGQGDVVAQTDIATDTLPPTVRQSNSIRPGQGGGSNAPGGATTPTSGPSAPNPPPSSPPGLPPVPPGMPSPPIVVDVTPFTSNPVLEIIPTSNGPSFSPAADPPGGTAVPEPATIALVFLGFAGLMFARSRKS
jgi:hypothetical protein